MKHFFVALQFLTRIKLVKQDSWTVADFGGSVPYFTAVGFIVGCLSAMLYMLLLPFLGVMATSLLVVAFHILITGGLHADGFMDTSDGLFSGREREKKLEIMKDSRVGSNGVVGFVFLILLKWQLLAALPPVIAPAILIVLSAISKAGLTMSVTSYPYARPEGMGKAFAQYAPSNSNALAWATSVLCLSPFVEFGVLDPVWWLLPVALVLIGKGTNVVLNRYMVKHLGGVTGDTYGFVSECTELILLLAATMLVPTVQLLTYIIAL